MPGRRLPTQPKDDSLCRRCQTLEPAIVVRTEPLCKGCFHRYVQTKVVKRMESFRVRNSELGKVRKLLLPLSYDACSAALLHILSQHLAGQTERTGRTGFTLCILHIDHELAAPPPPDHPFAKVQARYPEHEYHSAALSEVLSLGDVSDLFPHTTDEFARDRLQSILKAATSATARQDTLTILARRLIVQIAKDRDCEAIIWSDSTTKLAERTLADTAKGRGFSLPWTVADGDSPHGVAFYYPLREILTKEAEAYVSFVEPPLHEQLLNRTKTPNVSTKNMSIDHLMSQYFESVEQEYPSIVANVVRTTAKLQAPPLSQWEQHCELCNIPLEGQAPEKSRLCYGCIRAIPQTVD